MECVIGIVGIMIGPDETGKAALFLPWHRAYLRWFEDHLRDLDPNVAQCWWHWSSPLSHKEGIPKAFTVEKVDGSPNPLYKFHISEPSTGGVGSEPTLGPIDEILILTFQNLEGN